MQFDSPSFNERRFKCLNAQPVKRWGAVKHNRMAFDDLFKNVPNLRLDFFYHPLCTLDIMSVFIFYELLHDKGLEQFKRHLLGKSALGHFKVRTNDNNRTSRIVDTLS